MFRADLFLSLSLYFHSADEEEEEEKRQDSESEEEQEKRRTEKKEKKRKTKKEESDREYERDDGDGSEAETHKKEKRTTKHKTQDKERALRERLEAQQRQQSILAASVDGLREVLEPFEVPATTIAKLKEEEIDGRALAQMTHDDFARIGIKMGPEVKIRAVVEGPRHIPIFRPLSFFRVKKQP